jgi:hypothetical protein
MMGNSRQCDGGCYDGGVCLPCQAWEDGYDEGHQNAAGVTAERDRYRAALEAIVMCDWDDARTASVLGAAADMWDLAESALAPEPGKEPEGD